MGFTLPSSVASFLTSDVATTRALASLKSAVDPLLQLVGSCFEVTGDGMLRVKRPLLLDRLIATKVDVKTLIASLPAQFVGLVNRGLLDQAGDTRLKGTTVIQKKDDGTEGSLLVQNNVTVQGALSTGTGIKNYFDMGYYYNSSAVASTRYRTVTFTQNAQTSPASYQFPTLFQPMAAGSIIGIQTWSQGTAGGNVFAQVYKNTTVVTGAPLIDTLVGSAGQNFGGSISFAKGTYPFVALDYFPMTVAFGNAGNQAVQVRLFYEMTG